MGALVLLSACATSSGRGAEEQCAWRVCVSHADGASAREYTATNREPVPVTITLVFRAVENLRPPAGREVQAVVPPRSSATLARLPTIRQGRGVGARLAIQIDLGSSTSAVDEDFVYGVPFGGDEPREIVQGFDGIGTHRESMRYSLDFSMPVGTPILAARAGQVLLVQDGFVEGGVDPDLLERANLVVVAHSDGSMASYGHLQRGVRVRRGQEVQQGQLLGYSGDTGYAGQPHLHFHVGKRMLGAPGRTIPISMRSADGSVVTLDEGSWVPPVPGS